jgi:hypothetical protein
MTGVALVLAALAAGLSIAAFIRRPAVIEVVQPAAQTPAPETPAPVRLGGPREALRPGATSDPADELLRTPPRVFVFEADDIAPFLRGLGVPIAGDVERLGGRWSIQVRRSTDRAETAQKE